MLDFRKKILEPFIEEADLIPVDYFFKKGSKKSDPVGSYVFDSLDKIFYEIAKSLRRKKSLFKTFGYLYYCYLEKDVQEELGKFDANSKFKPLQRDTILQYKRKIIKLMHKEVNENQELKNIIIKTIKEEYEKACNQKRT